MALAEGGAHFLLHGSPYLFQASAHPRLAISENPPLPDVSWVGFKVQRPRDATTSEGPVKGLAMVVSHCYRTLGP